MTVTVRPWPHWHPAAQRITADDEPCTLTIGPTRDNRSVEFTVGPANRADTHNPDVLRAFADAFHHWADHLEHELARPPVGQTELTLDADVAPEGAPT